MLEETWRTKWDYLWRAFHELQAVVEDSETNEHIEARRVLTRFCSEAFELREWILKSDDVEESAKSAAAALFGTPGRRRPGTDESIALKACADIANEAKHFKLTRSSWSRGGHAQVVFEHVSSIQELPDMPFAVVGDVTSTAGNHSWTWIISADGHEYDALLLAVDAMRAWEQFLSKHGLISPDH
jgi:hypothetical protein